MRRGARMYATDKPRVKKDGTPVADLDSLTKDELLQLASERGIDVSSSMTKDEIKAVLEAG